MSAFPELTGNRFCTKKAIGLAPAGGLSVFCLHFGAVSKIVFRGRKICALYFKICLTYFEICRTYFLFAPTWGLRAENQFSFFRAKKCRFSIPVSCGFIVCATCGKEREKKAVHTHEHARPFACVAAYAFCGVLPLVFRLGTVVNVFRAPFHVFEQETCVRVV